MLPCMYIGEGLILPWSVEGFWCVRVTVFPLSGSSMCSISFNRHSARMPNLFCVITFGGNVSIPGSIKVAGLELVREVDLLFVVMALISLSVALLV